MVVYGRCSVATVDIAEVPPWRQSCPLPGMKKARHFDKVRAGFSFAQVHPIFSISYQWPLGVSFGIPGAPISSVSLADESVGKFVGKGERTLKAKQAMLIGAIILIVALTGLAKNARTLTLRTPVTLQGTEISAGQYEVSWVSHSPTATITFTQNNTTVATADGKWVDRDVTYPADAVMYTNNADGSHTLVEIRFGGTIQALVFSNPN
jgi:hypothetical protein